MANASLWLSSKSRKFLFGFTLVFISSFLIGMLRWSVLMGSSTPKENFKIKPSYLETDMPYKPSVSVDEAFESRVNSSMSSLFDPDRVTIIMPSYRRVEALLVNPTLEHLVPLDFVDRVLIIWNEVEATVPQSVYDRIQNLGIQQKSLVIRPKTNSLNNRFIPWPEIRTEAVFCIDDDFKVTLDSFKTGWAWWKVNRFRLVGLYPRHFVKESDTEFVYGMYDKRGQPFNAVLSGGGLFLNRRFLERYTNEMPSDLREYVHSHFNCEDILMQWTVPAAFHPPLVVMVNDWISKNTAMFTSEDVDKKTGISRRKGHSNQRRACLEKFNAALGWPFITSKTTVSEIPPF